LYESPLRSRAMPPRSPSTNRSHGIPPTERTDNASPTTGAER
jgi:hypothetical protein